MKVIDVSVHNGTIDWTKVANDKTEGVIIRAGYGRLASQKDSSFETFYSGASKAGLHIGAYWYSYALSADEAKTEAEAFLKVIKGKKFDLPIYLDIEDKKQLALSKSTCTAITEAFMSVLEQAGYFAGVYSYDSFFESNLEASIREKYAIWVARVENVKPKYATEWGIHQYSWKGTVNGITGDTDMDNCIKDYPSIIKKAKLNGYGEYKVKAELTTESAEKADETSKICQNCGMTVVIS